MEFKNKLLSSFSPRQWIFISALGFFLVFVLPGLFSYNSEAGELKKQIKKGEAKIESLEETKDPIYKQIKDLQETIKKKDLIIENLETEKQTIKNTLIFYRNENKRIKSDYLNNDINERVRIFSKLAAEKN